ncbi:MAG: hypothetical protein K5885_01945, partial [Bacteroidales bacterium]|nr:hypothetical protein [Bacteroidales bacterium]
MMLPQSGGSATGLIVPEAAPDAFNQTSWQPHGKANTLQLVRSGNSPAANAVDVYNGWYIPDIMQLNMIYRYMPLLENDVTSNGGNTGSFLLHITGNNSSHCYASSTPNNSKGDMFYVINMGSYSDYSKGEIALGRKGGLSWDEGYKIRPVREFGNEVEAYWVAPYNATGEKTNTMTVTPDETTTYDAVVVFGHDTFPATSTVAVHESYNSDTLYEITCMCNHRAPNGCDGCYNAYNSTKSSLFTGLDICPHDYYYYDYNTHTYSFKPYTRPYTRTTQSQFGCDSTITLILTVVECSNLYTDTLCPLTEDYYFAPFDTTFKPGTVSGIYEHHGTKVVSGSAIDTVAYYDLTILEDYMKGDTTELCLSDNSVTTWENNPNVTITVTDHEVFVTSASPNVVIDATNASEGIYMIIEKAVTGCDSVTFLHIKNTEGKSVFHADTLYVDHPFDYPLYGHNFRVVGPGVMTHTDTIPGGANNNCDSITTRILIVEELHYDTICQEELATYTWRGKTLPASTDSHGYYEFPGWKIIDGTKVDTISYLLLTVNPNPTVTLSNLTVCPNDEAVDLTATLASATAPNYTYEWSGDLTVSPTPVTTDQLTATTTATVPDAPASCGQTYTMNVKVTDGNGCEATDDATVTVKTPTKPVISTLLTDDNLGCNPNVIAPVFTVSDNCEGTFTLDAANVVDGGVTGTGCEKSQTWTANYTDGCGNPATPVSITYYWTEDHTVPELHTEAVSDHKGCNPVIVTPTFTVTDNCEGTFVLSADSVTTTGKTGDGCEKSQSWTAHYTDGCGNPATPLTVTYSWKEDTQKPVIATTATDSYLGCDPTTITPPTFSVSDNCEGDFALPTDSVTDGGVVAVTSEPYKFSRTWTAHFTDLCGNKADNVSITYTWVEAPTVTISCPPDVRDTLAFGDCVMNIYPAEIGTPTVNAPADWPITVSNDIPADNLYSEGETIIHWVATDGICGYSVSCQQKVIVVFPQCPDAVDCEGNVYHGVRIDCDCWTQTNLQSNYYGDPGACEEEIPCKYTYDANAAAEYGIDILNDNFGRLY